jgi:hypothetical protein
MPIDVEMKFPLGVRRRHDFKIRYSCAMLDLVIVVFLEGLPVKD